MRNDQQSKEPSTKTEKPRPAQEPDGSVTIPVQTDSTEENASKKNDLLATILNCLANAQEESPEELEAALADRLTPALEKIQAQKNKAEAARETAEEEAAQLRAKLEQYEQVETNKADPKNDQALIQLSKQNDQLAAELDDANAQIEALREKAERYEEAEAARKAAENEAAQLRAEEDRMKRSMAHYHDQANRAEKALKEARDYGSAGLLRELIPVRDEMTYALRASEMVSVSVNAIQGGLKGTIKKMDAALENAGVEPVDPVAGEPMDPNMHQAEGVVAVAIPGYQKNDVVEVQQRGYQLRGRVLRPALVIVAGVDAPTEEETPTETAPQQDPDKEAPTEESGSEPEAQDA